MIHARTLVLIALACFLSVGLLGWCAGRASRTGALREAEASILRAGGALTAAEASRAEIEEHAAGLEEQLTALREAGVRPVVREVVRWRSAPMTAQGPAPEPVIVQIPGDCQVPPPVDCGDCLLAAGSVLDVRVAEARVETEHGAAGLVGRAEVWRLVPSPEARIAEGPLRADLSSWRVVEGAAPVASPRVRRWAASVDVGLGVDGPIYAAAVERRVSRRAWVGLAGGTEGVAARVRWEW